MFTPYRPEHQYRPEIDGLRAFAVVPVLLFHAGFSWFSGGFVGVDVFFVISGYLITGLIAAELTRGRFSIVNFYERRARRILPALFVVLACCLPAAWVWLLPPHLKSFANSLVAVSLFSSNVLFWIGSGYFAPAAESKPLLHTWSLGVEEQYYILFPLLLAWLWVRGPNRAKMVVVLVALGSFAASCWAQDRYPDANFYLAPTRAWELLSGAFVALSSYDGSLQRLSRPFLSEVLALCGLILICFAVGAFNSNTPFPGVYATAPVLGAALIVGFARPTTFVGRLLASPIFVGVGLISYSLYLWHQPIFAFARAASMEALSGRVYAALLLLSTAIAYLSWRFIERPFRAKDGFSRRWIFRASITGSCLFIALGLVGHMADGFPSRLSLDQRRIQAMQTQAEAQTEFNACFLDLQQEPEMFGTCQDGPPTARMTIFLWGDSHAAHLYPGLTRMRGENQRLVHFTASGCAPILDITLRTRPNCSQVNRWVFKQLSVVHPDRVILAARWGFYDWRQLNKTIAAIRALGVRDIQVIGPVPVWTDTVPNMLTRLDLPPQQLPTRLNVGLERGLKHLDRTMSVAVRAWGAHYVSAYSTLCNHDGCTVKGQGGEQSIIYKDYSHFSTFGSGYFCSLVPELMTSKNVQDDSHPIHHEALQQYETIHPRPVTAD